MVVILKFWIVEMLKNCVKEFYKYYKYIWSVDVYIFIYIFMILALEFNFSIWKITSGIPGYTHSPVKITIYKLKI